MLEIGEKNVKICINQVIWYYRSGLTFLMDSFIAIVTDYPTRVGDAIRCYFSVSQILSCHDVYNFLIKCLIDNQLLIARSLSDSSKCVG